MKLIHNTGYFLKEVTRIIRLNFLSNLFSVLGTGLILFLLGLMVTGWNISNKVVERLEKEAEVSVYFYENVKNNQAEEIMEYITSIDGVESARIVNQGEAYEQMQEILGEEAKVLELFHENPFEAYGEVRINLNQMDIVLSKISMVEGISYLRDNKSVLEQVQQLSNGLQIITYLVMFAVGITTLVIISHLIRQSIYNNKEQINTLRLLGAPDSFIGLPFLISGILLTATGGLMATILIVFLVQMGYNQLAGTLPFIPLPDKRELLLMLSILLPLVSIMLGILGSIFGLSKEK
jgi:cell division transport system permease protein